MESIFYSIITIVKNGMPYFRDTVSSVANQGYKNYEYIVIDAESSDGTVDVIKSNQSNVYRWVSEPDNGIASAFNKGINFAKGDYILFLNADDSLIDPDTLSKVSNAISENQYPDFLYGDCEVIDRTTAKTLYRASIDITLKDFLYGRTFPHPSTFTKKEYFQKYGFFDEKFKIAMDYELFMRGIHESRIVHTPILVTRVRNGGVSTLDQKHVAKEIILALKKNGYLNKYFAESRLRFYFWIRRCVSSILSAMGIYKSFQEIRNYINNRKTIL